MQFEYIYSLNYVLCQDAEQPMFLETIAVTFILACVVTAVSKPLSPNCIFSNGRIDVSRALRLNKQKSLVGREAIRSDLHGE